ncbi:MAG TPA: hypothetical protein VFH74_05815 [Gaiellales bacterium]|nr:hypothetical protein [Gaiellales bacterium]
MVSPTRSPRGTALLQWYAVLGGPVAWFGQLILGYFYTLSLCGPGGPSLGGLHVPVGIYSGLGALVAAGGFLSALALHRATSNGLDDPLGRIRFIADIGLVIGALFLALILYTAGGELALGGCR